MHSKICLQVDNVNAIKYASRHFFKKKIQRSFVGYLIIN
jgi:hypothetical protein